MYAEHSKFVTQEKPLKWGFLANFVSSIGAGRRAADATPASAPAMSKSGWV
jgi:hypothetical protein